VVTTAVDANEAFHLATKQPFDLVITEDTLACSSGVALARQLRFSEQYDTTPIVMLTDEKPEGLDLELLRKNLMVLVIHKPYNPVDLVTKIASWLPSSHSPC
jgi:CheY-like chemotaxis protein